MNINPTVKIACPECARRFPRKGGYYVNAPLADFVKATAHAVESGEPFIQFVCDRCCKAIRAEMEDEG